MTSQTPSTIPEKHADALARTDRITLTGLRNVGYHGVLDSEKQEGQPFIVDVVLYLNLAPAAQTDDVAHTVNYAEVAELVRDIVTGTAVDLIETLAEKIAQAILSHFPVIAVEITVNKPQAPIEVPFSNVSVTIMREKK